MSKLNLVQSPAVQTEALNQAVLSYKEIRAKIKFLENELKPHKTIIEDAASNTPDGKIVSPTYSISLAIVESERLDREAAQKALGELLKPFISVGISTRLTVN